MQRNITLEIGSIEFECLVEFDYTPEVQAKTHGLPENCYPGEPEEIDVYQLTITKSPGIVETDISVLIEAFTDEIENGIREKFYN